MKKIITTVGTSLFSNYMNDQVKNYYGHNYASIEGAFEKTKNANATDIYLDDFLPYIKSIQEKIEDYWFEYPDDVPNLLASAEIASILKIVEEEPDETFEVHFIATDTLQSVLAAEMITNWFEKYKAVSKQIKGVLFQYAPTGFDHQKLSDYVVKDLQVSKQENYEKGVMNLLDLLNRITEKDTLLNITGGYKAIVPVVTIWAQIKKLTIKYLFDESELKTEGQPLSLNNLPMNLDWVVVEALKPILKNYILEKMNPLAKLVKDSKKVKFQKNRYLYTGTIQPDSYSELDQIIPVIHQATHSLLYYKLIHITNDDRFEITPLGKILIEANVGDEKGFVIEHLLFKYFSYESDGILKQYKVTRPPDALPFGYQILDKNTFSISLSVFKPERNNDSIHEIGDIDIPLQADNIFVWAESKAYSTACGYYKQIGKKSDYYFQLKARTLALKTKKNEPIEILLLVFRFVFKNLNDSAFLDSNHFNEVLKHFEKLNKDEDIKGFATFRCIGITIPVDFDKDRIDFTTFYKANFAKWQFEELKT